MVVVAAWVVERTSRKLFVRKRLRTSIVERTDMRPCAACFARIERRERDQSNYKKGTPRHIRFQSIPTRRRRHSDPISSTTTTTTENGAAPNQTAHKAAELRTPNTTGPEFSIYAQQSTLTLSLTVVVRRRSSLSQAFDRNLFFSLDKRRV